MYGNSNEWDLYLRPVSHDKYVIAISHCKHGRRMMTKQNKTKQKFSVRAQLWCLLCEAVYTIDSNLFEI
jgi:hypothetical protein